jgi:hypothetical protein
MKQHEWRHQTISIVSMFALLVANAFFDHWQESLKKGFGETFEIKFTNQRLWSIPVAAFLVAICILILFRFLIKHNNKYTAILFLVVGLCVLFYPTLSITFRVISILKISVNCFADSVVFYTGALVAAMGLIGIMAPSEK